VELGFLVKKFISFFVEPLGMVFTLLILGIYNLYAKKESKAEKFLVSSLFLLFLFSYPPFANFLVKNLENQYLKYDYSGDVKYIHVLGNGHSTDKDQPISSKLSNAATKRVLEGVIIHKNLANSKIIFTGFKGDTNISNAEMNSELAMALGVSENNIIINPKPKDTNEEAIFTKSIVGDEPFILVTSATHMPRAMALFHAQGLKPIPAPTNFCKEDFRGYLRAPDVRYLQISTLAMHEYIGIVWAKIRGVFS
jgi:uncharacterized SAM-binding protein YcdF (DUF218 family)